MGDRELYCEDCGAETLFETPPCQDGHGADCPELVCTGCGTALLTAGFPPLRAARGGTRTDAPARRHRAA
ncbi:hypothetical protein [Micromonospora echinofusca]|uniref:Small CPxCG-related zinc finger protein n=1 Tax=Micromonospora echinofusca TaxID=47858 RepID=A0ABS3VXI0_MICEH|nr:hypothetical protein [Micromonospora echinofusca]MBO4209247.1 hypothetical protein [Micromonospora echinofusca]